MANYLGRREKGVKKIREKGDENLGDMGPFNVRSGVVLTLPAADDLCQSSDAGGCQSHT